VVAVSALAAIDDGFGAYGLQAPATGILVDNTGVRFVDESGSSTLLATTIVDGQKYPVWGLYDSSDADIVALLEKGLDSGELFKGETIEDVAAASGLAQLPTTFAAYQAIAAAGIDTEFDKAPEDIVAYGAGPYYLVHLSPSYVTTMGGVRTNDDCQVITADGTPIEGLYACGELTHRFMYNRSFISAASNGSGITMGRLTGEAVAAALV
jgi:succinate dehydrogenase/fumarate reductase flavoprotein subunit